MDAQVQSMNILTLENDPQDLAFIQQALNGSRYTLIPVLSSEKAWQYVQSGESRFLIANWDASDLRDTQFIPRARAAKLFPPLYILLTTTKNLDDAPPPGGADDVLRKPFTAAELRSRVIIAERVIALTNDLLAARKQLESRALFDSLTNLMNRRAFLLQAGAEMERARRAALPLSVIALDIDDFKTINDAYGSELGDEVLRTISQTIREKSRPYDCIGRWSGDEFMIALAGVIGADAEKIAARIIAGVRGTRVEVPNEAVLNVKLSAGIAAIARIGTSTEMEPLIEQARQAVSRAKEAGGSQVFLVYV
jgi:diguanylate cyclase (GGDEF)-like protein